MKVIFLDIDGVLNREGTEERCGPFIGVDRELSNKLLTWLHTTDVKIVLSSTWRNHPDMHDHLHEAGIEWVDRTPRIPGADRGEEIKFWLSENPIVTDYAILDDTSDMLSEQKPFFVWTDADAGIQDRDIEKLNNILNKKKNDETFRHLPGEGESPRD